MITKSMDLISAFDNGHSFFHSKLKPQVGKCKGSLVISKNRRGWFPVSTQTVHE